MYNKKEENKRTLVGVVLDRSGSMMGVKADTIGGFNSFIAEQKDSNQNQVFVITQFDTQYEVLQDGAELKEVKNLDESNYIPRGATALLDAMGQTISKMDSILDGDPTIKQSILVVLTDGDENSSREFTRDQIFNLIKEREEKSWSFTFLGAGQDAIKQASNMGINNAAQYSGDSLGTTQAFNNISRSVSTYSCGGSAKLDS